MSFYYHYENIQKNVLYLGKKFFYSVFCDDQTKEQKRFKRATFFVGINDDMKKRIRRNFLTRGLRIPVEINFY
jgi:hypothetical protein